MRIAGDRKSLQVTFSSDTFGESVFDENENDAMSLAEGESYGLFGEHCGDGVFGDTPYLPSASCLKPGNPVVDFALGVRPPCCKTHSPRRNLITDYPEVQ